MKKVNAERLWQMLMEMAKIGATDKGGNTRLALTDEDVAGRALLIEWAKKLIFLVIMMRLVT